MTKKQRKCSKIVLLFMPVDISSTLQKRQIRFAQQLKANISGQKIYSIISYLFIKTFGLFLCIQQQQKNVCKLSHMRISNEYSFKWRPICKNYSKNYNQKCYFVYQKEFLLKKTWNEVGSQIDTNKKIDIDSSEVQILCIAQSISLKNQK